MNKEVSRHQHRHRPQHTAEQFRFRLTPLAAIMAGMTLLSSGSVYAADDKAFAELQAEVTRLKQELEKSQQELATQKGAQAAPAANAPAAAEPAPEANASAAPAAEEPQTLDTVVVRSRNRIERLQDVPLSVSVVTGKELERLGANDLTAITKRAANVSWNQGNQRTSSLSIRGIGKIGQLEAQDPSVGLIVDGVPLAFNPISSSYNFTDVDAVEVTRGPQGTLLGKNTSLGVINVTTRRPSFTPSADYSLTIGQRDKVIGNFAAGGPIQDGVLAYRANLSVEKGAGDVENHYAYDKDRTYTNTDRVTGRLQFLLTPSSDFSARLALDATPNGGEYTNTRVFNTPTPTTYASGAANSLTNDVRVQRRWFTQNPGYYTYQRDYLSQGYLKVDGGYPLVTGNNGVAAELNWNLGDHTLSSITAYKNYHFNAKNDEGTPFAISTTGGVHDNYQQISQELRLSSKTGGFVDYQTGLFLIQTKTDYTSYNNWLQDAGAWYANSSVKAAEANNPDKNQYAILDADGNGRYLMGNSVNGMFKKTTNDIRNKSEAIFGQANWHLSEPLTLTTGIRLTKENRTNPSSVLIIDNGVGAELNPVTSAGGVAMGGFSSDKLTGELTGTNSAAQLALANQVAQKYFNKASYGDLTAQEKIQVAAAKNLRNGQIGTLYNTTSPSPFSKVQPNLVLSPSYKVNEDLTTYFSVQYGEKAGIAQVVNGVEKDAKPEKTLSYEWGFKSAWLNKTLIFNADIYLMNIKDYQQAVSILDPASDPASLKYISYTGNAPKVQAKGLEIDGVYSGIPRTTLRFSGAFNDARYKDFREAPQPVENGDLKSPNDLTGRTLAGAARVTWNIGADYRQPVFGDKEFHAAFNTAYTSRYNSDVALSSYAWIPGHYTTDLAIGLGRQNKAFDVTLLVKNAFNDRTPVAQSWNTWSPAYERWIGVMFTGKL